MKYSPDGYSRIRHKHTLASLCGRIVIFSILLALACAQPAALAYSISALDINQIVQNDGEFIIYASLLDTQNKPVIGGSGNPQEYTIQIGASTPIHPDTVATFQQIGQGVAYIIAVDVSGSVTKAECDAIKQSLRSFVNEMGYNDYVKLITIGTSVQIECDYTNDRARLLSLIDSKIHRNDQKTNLFQGLYRAMEGINARPQNAPIRDTVIVFSDGMDDSNRVWTENNVLELMQSTGKAPVYSIAIKGNAKNVDSSALNRLSELTGGIMFQADKADMISNAVADIRLIVNSTAVLTCAPEDDAVFGVKDQSFRVNLQTSGVNVTSAIYTKTTIPPSARPSKTLEFTSPEMARAVSRAIGKPDSEGLTSEDEAAIEALTTLNADKYGITTLADIWRMPNLETLSAKGNSLGGSGSYGTTDEGMLGELQKLRFLKSLDLEDNRLDDITPLKYLTGLESLNLRDNKITTLDALDSMTQLVMLDASKNSINDISALLKLTNLTSLDLADNDIDDVRELTSLESLRTLNLSQNEISDVSMLSKMTWLETLDLKANKVQNTIPLYPLAQAGCVIDLTSNPTEYVAAPTPVPTPIVTPKPTPKPLTGMQKIANWFSTYWMYALGGFLVIVVLIIILVARTARKDKKLLEGINIDDDLRDYDPTFASEDLDKTLPSEEIGGFDPDATIPLNAASVTRVRFVAEYAGRTREYTKPIGKELTIGRSSECTLELEDRHVSRVHAKITMKYNGMFIQDMGSTSGTSVNGIAVVGETALKQGDVIKLGDTTLKMTILV